MTNLIPFFSYTQKSYTTIEACLQLERRSYARLNGHESVRKVILPHSSLTVFETSFEAQEGEAAIDQVRQQLAPITLTVTFHDIYDNKMIIKRGFQWFARHAIE